MMGYVVRCRQPMEVSFSLFPYVRVVVEEWWVSDGLLVLLLLRVIALAMYYIRMRWCRLLCKWAQWLLNRSCCLVWRLHPTTTIWQCRLLRLVLLYLTASLLKALLCFAHTLGRIGLILCSSTNCYALLAWDIGGWRVTSLFLWITAPTYAFLPDFLRLCQ